MGWLDRLLGREEERSGQGVGAERLSDEQAVERYRYLLRTAPPEAIEQAHAEAFAQLTPEQRARVLRELAAQATEHERATAGDDPRSLARLATRAEMRQPGTLERTLGSVGGGGMRLGGVLAGSLLASIAGSFIGTAIAQQLLAEEPGAAGLGGDAFAAEEAGHGGFDAAAGGFDEGAGFEGGDFGEV
jgi:hypothetical protein